VSTANGDLPDVSDSMSVTPAVVLYVGSYYAANYVGRMTPTTISFLADERIGRELKALAAGRSYSDAIREAIHAQYAASLYTAAAADAERLQNDPDDLAEVKAVNEELDEIGAR
jgi:hypothetical protein